MTTQITRRAELAHRRSAGIDVHLFWNVPTSRVTVGVVDARTDDSFEFEVDGRHEAPTNPRRSDHARSDR